MVQAASLADYGVPAFSERIEAWKMGPMVRGIAGVYKDFDSEPIEEPESGDPANATGSLDLIVDQILNEYGDESGPELAGQLKVQGSPWRTVREAAGIPAGEPASVEIDTDTMRAWHHRFGVTVKKPTRRESRLIDRYLEGDSDAFDELVQIQISRRVTS